MYDLGIWLLNPVVNVVDVDAGLKFNGVAKSKGLRVVVGLVVIVVELLLMFSFGLEDEDWYILLLKLE